MSILKSVANLFVKIDEFDPMHYEGAGKSLPDPETYPEGFENRNPLARSYEFAADSDPSLVEEFDEQFYKNLSPHGKAVLVKSEPRHFPWDDD